ncbi:MAG: hypothetical protein LBB82_07695, partial [Treponema sp.]|nr:hypothetical protein [Treponema sp.]
FVVFATQEVADVGKSAVKSTVIQQCLTKIYLADPSALTAGMIDVYRTFGLSDSEIALIAASTMKRDYFYTSPLGRRLFQLDLGPLTLALVGAPDHALLDALSAEYGPGVPLCRPLLDALRVDYRPFLGRDAPGETTERPPAPPPPLPAALPPPPPGELSYRAAPRLPAAEILDAVARVRDRRGKGEGRAADSLAETLGVSPATVYQARRLLKRGGEDLIARVRRGEITIKKACARLADGETA